MRYLSEVQQMKGKFDIRGFFGNAAKNIKDFFGRIDVKAIINMLKNPKKMTLSQKRKLLVYGGGSLLILIIFIVIICLIAHSVGEKKRIEKSGCTFTTEGYEDVAEAECIDNKIIVFTAKNGKKGIMLLNGEITEEAKNKEIYAVSEEWNTSSVVAENSSSEYVLCVDTESGKVLTRQYQGVGEPPRTPAWSEENNGLIWVYKEGTVSSVESGDIVLPSGLYAIPDRNSPPKYGFIDASLQLVIPARYKQVAPFSEDLAAAEVNGKWGYIDRSGQVAVPFDYESAGSFMNGLAPVCKDGVYGIINRNNVTAVSFDFEKILNGKDGKFLAKKDGKWGLITVNKNIYDTENTYPSTSAPAAVMCRVKTSGGTLNMRESAGRNANVVAELPNGTELEYLAKEENWVKVSYNGTEGYVYSDYIEIIG